MLVVGEFIFCLFGVLLRLRVCVCTERWASGTLMPSTHNCSAKKTTNPFFWAVDSAVWEWSMAMLEKKFLNRPINEIYVLFFFFSSFHAELPESRPTLYTEYDRYEPGDVLRANCSSPPSRPQVELTLTINNMVVSAKFRFHVQRFPLIRIAKLLNPFSVSRLTRTHMTIALHSLMLFHSA